MKQDSRRLPHVTLGHACLLDKYSPTSHPPFLFSFPSLPIIKFSPHLTIFTMLKLSPQPTSAFVTLPPKLLLLPSDLTQTPSPPNSHFPLVYLYIIHKIPPTF